MFRIDPYTLYSRKDLSDHLKPMGINADAWITRLKPEKRFRLAWWGRDLIEAIEAAPALAEKHETAEPPAARNGGNRRGRRRAEGRTGAKLDQAIRELRGEAK